jgi:hypothetical protein
VRNDVTELALLEESPAGHARRVAEAYRSALSSSAAAAW